MPFRVRCDTTANALRLTNIGCKFNYFFAIQKWKQSCYPVTKANAYTHTHTSREKFRTLEQKGSQVTLGSNWEKWQKLVHTQIVTHTHAVSQCLLHILWTSVYYNETYKDGRNWSPVAETDTNSIFKILVLGSSNCFWTYQATCLVHWSDNRVTSNWYLLISKGLRQLLWCRLECENHKRPNVVIEFCSKWKCKILRKWYLTITWAFLVTLNLSQSIQRYVNCWHNKDAFLRILHTHPHSMLSIHLA